MCYINNDFFFSSLICITFYRRKSNTLPISKSVLIASLHKCTQSPCDHAHHCNTLVRIRNGCKNALFMRKASACIRNLQLLPSSWMGHRKSSAALLIVCERIVLLLGADYSSADQVRTKDDALLKRVLMTLDVDNVGPETFLKSGSEICVWPLK